MPDDAPVTSAVPGPERSAAVICASSPLPQSGGSTAPAPGSTSSVSPRPGPSPDPAPPASSSPPVGGSAPELIGSTSPALTPGRSGRASSSDRTVEPASCSMSATSSPGVCVTARTYPPRGASCAGPGLRHPGRMAAEDRGEAGAEQALARFPRPAVVVLVGAAGSGETHLPRALVAAGFDAGLVVSLDDLRREARAADAAAGRAVLPLQAYSLSAVRRANRRCDALAGFGAGYLADATHLRRRERMVHVRAGASCGRPAVAVLLPDQPLDVLLRRDAARPRDERVPPEVLARHAHRRGLLSGRVLLEEGFATVIVM